MVGYSLELFRIGIDQQLLKKHVVRCRCMHFAVDAEALYDTSLIIQEINVSGPPSPDAVHSTAAIDQEPIVLVEFIELMLVQTGSQELLGPSLRFITLPLPFRCLKSLLFKEPSIDMGCWLCAGRVHSYSAVLLSYPLEPESIRTEVDPSGHGCCAR
jgi:hypothetical protein